MKNGLLLCAWLVVSFCSAAQLARVEKGVYLQRMNALRQNIQTVFYDSTTGYFKEFNRRDSNDRAWSFLWPLCGLIQAANEVEAVQPQVSYFPFVMKAIYAYDDGAAPAPGYNSYIMKEKVEDRFYDDNQWIGIAAMDAYKRTGNKAYLDEGRKVYRFMMTGFDTVGGGGLYWKEGDLTTKNTCSNGPAILVALQLYNATKEQPYLDTAKMLYQWLEQTLLAPEGVYWDNLKLPSRQPDKRFYTYNAGTPLQSAVMLYEITNEKKYLTQAQNIAAAAHNVFFKNGSWGNNYWFNAVLLRGYQQLYRHDKNPVYINAFISDAERIWEKERDEQGLVGHRRKKELLDQAAMLEIYARLVQMQ